MSFSIESSKAILMQYSNLLKGFIEELDNCYVLMKKKDGKDMDVEYIFKNFVNQKLASVQEIIDDINKLIDERKSLKEEIFKDFESAKLNITNILLQQDSNLSQEEKLELRKKLVEIDESKAAEKLNAWRDISQLKKELREHLRDFRDKSQRNDMLESMI